MTRTKFVVLALAAFLTMGALAAALSAPASAQSASGQAVVAEAESWLGTPYVWGGTSRGGVDCSGLTVAVFQQFGVDLPRTAAAQYGAGAPSNGAAGDIVFGDFGSGGITHVGIAVGDGTMINAPYPGTTVRYDEIYPQYTVGYNSVV